MVTMSIHGLFRRSKESKDVQPLRDDSIGFPMGLPSRVSDDLWQMAYDQLDNEDQRVLSRDRILSAKATDRPQEPQTTVCIAELIDIIKAQYKDLAAEADGKARSSLINILAAALSFRDASVVNLAYDPNAYATSAWAMVSAGLTIAMDYQNQRGALFDSFECLADALAQCACTEAILDSASKIDQCYLRMALARLYKAILKYTAHITRDRDASKTYNEWDLVTTITKQPFTELKASVANEKDALSPLAESFRHLHREAEAREILRRVNQLADSIRDLDHQFILSNLPVAHEALYNTFAPEYATRCLPGTRTELLTFISKWAESADSETIFWLSGMPGTGKSTVARTVADLLQAKDQLGATFFFGPGVRQRGSARYLFATIVKQLATQLRQLIPAVVAAMKDDPILPSKSLSEQFEKLILQPLLSLHLDQPTRTVIVIDALDECDEDHIRVILRLLPRLRSSQSVSLRIFLTSRPELRIRLELMHINDHRGVSLDDLSASEIENDIRLFLEDKFSLIRNKGRLSEDWPGSEIIERLTNMSTPLFFYAELICRYIEDSPWDPVQKLDHILSVPHKPLEEIYLSNLNHLLDHSEENKTKNLIQEFRGTSLRTILIIPEDVDAPVNLLHFSLRGFLNSTDTQFRVSEAETHAKITSHCFRVMGQSLKQDICRLYRAEARGVDVPIDIIDKCFPSSLQYACSYWAHHLKRADPNLTSEVEIRTFLQQYLLHWLEALSLMGKGSESIIMLYQLRELSLTTEYTQLAAFIHDAWRFAWKNRWILDNAPLELYSSALMFAPKESLVRRAYEHLIPAHVHRLPQVQLTWGAGLAMLVGHDKAVSAIAFSPDNRLIATASWDHKVIIWDASTGKDLQTLHGHTNVVCAVAFSADSKILASASWDETVHLWDVRIGEQLQTLQCESTVTAVVFSPDCQHISSAYADCVTIWNSTTGQMQSNPKLHSSSLNVIAFSPDGKLIAAGSDDGLVILWGVDAEEPHRICDGHSFSVEVVQFSPDGGLLASASSSDDGIIMLWDPATGEFKGSLIDHLDYVSDVKFSLEGRMLASASGDGTIKLWDIGTGQVSMTLAHGQGAVTMIDFSPDCALIASAAADRCLRLWNVGTGTLISTLKGHTAPVNAIAFSRDGSLLASASSDSTIWLWDVYQARSVAYENNAKGVQKLAISPDGLLVASANSTELRVRLWSTTTGLPCESFDTRSPVRQLSFSEDGSYLEANEERFDVESSTEAPPSTVKCDELCSIDQGWICMKSDKLFKIPQGYRAAVIGRLVVLSDPAGEVSFLEVSLD
ncbi:hypothetical protein ABZX51_003521 [Aspergillus tubingensis]